jgi:hypothetical protein
MIGYRICERNNSGELLTLFHGVNGSRKMDQGVWYSADIKPVRDGDPKRAKLYTSGFHFLFTYEECQDYLSRFTAPRDLVVVECEVEGVRQKHHSRSNVWLADKMKLIKVCV